MSAGFVRADWVARVMFEGWRRRFGHLNAAILRAPAFEVTMPQIYTHSDTRQAWLFYASCIQLERLNDRLSAFSFPGSDWERANAEQADTARRVRQLCTYTEDFPRPVEGLSDRDSIRRHVWWAEYCLRLSIAIDEPDGPFDLFGTVPGGSLANDWVQAAVGRLTEGRGVERACRRFLRLERLWQRENFQHEQLLHSNPSTVAWLERLRNMRLATAGGMVSLLHQAMVKLAEPLAIEAVKRRIPLEATCPLANLAHTGDPSEFDRAAARVRTLLVNVLAAGEDDHALQAGAAWVMGLLGSVVGEVKERAGDPSQPAEFLTIAKADICTRLRCSETKRLEYLKAWDADDGETNRMAVIPLKNIPQYHLEKLLNEAPETHLKPLIPTERHMVAG